MLCENSSSMRQEIWYYLWIQNKLFQKYIHTHAIQSPLSFFFFFHWWHQKKDSDTLIIIITHWWHQDKGSNTLIIIFTQKFIIKSYSTSSSSLTIFQQRKSWTLKATPTNPLQKLNTSYGNIWYFATPSIGKGYESRWKQSSVICVTKVWIKKWKCVWGWKVCNYTIHPCCNRDFYSDITYFLPTSLKRPGVFHFNYT